MSYIFNIYALIILIGVIVLIKVYDKFLKETKFMKKILSIFKKVPDFAQLVYNIFLNILPSGLSYSLIKILIISLPTLIERFYNNSFSIEWIDEVKRIIIEKIDISIENQEEKNYLINIINSLDNQFLFNIINLFINNSGFAYIIFEDLETKQKNILEEISTIIKDDNKELMFSKPDIKISMLNKYSRFINIKF